MNVQRAQQKLIKRITAILEEWYGCSQPFEGIWFYNQKDQKLFILSLDADNLDLSQLRINSLGLYVGEINEAQTEIRLSLDASQIVGKYATKNILKLSDEVFAKWCRGISIYLDEKLKKETEHLRGYILISNTQNDFFGVGRIKNDELLSFVSKSRFIKGNIREAHELQ